MEDEEGNPISSQDAPINTLNLDDLPSENMPENLPATASEVPRLRHRLRNHADAWRKLGHVSCLVMSIILSGLQINWNTEGKFAGPASPCDLPNHPSVSNNIDFVDSTIHTALLQGAVRIVPDDLRGTIVCIMPLGVAVHKRTGKLRLIFDCRHLNQYVKYEKFKMDQLSTVGRTIFAGASHAYSVDISSAYYHVDLNEDAIPFFGFRVRTSFQ